MSALGGGLNRSTQHSISFYLLGFEPQGLARTASDTKVPWFLCRSEASKKPSTFRHALRLSLSRQRVLRRPVEPAVIIGHGDRFTRGMSAKRTLWTTVGVSAGTMPPWRSLPPATAGGWSGIGRPHLGLSGIARERSASRPQFHCANHPVLS